jgi:CubicO group peptidase (beta-lactamase class C family)
MAPPGTYPIQDRIRADRIGGDGPPLPARMPGLNEWLRSLGALPLIAQPGTRWMYHVSMDVLGALVARVSGQPLGAFMRERVFEPLGMKDTAFHVPADKSARLPGCYRFDPAAGALELFDDPARSAWAEPAFESGGGGLVSTIDDWFVFMRMLLDHGRRGRAQILARATVALMTSDQVPPERRPDADIFFGEFGSWGFGMGVDIHRADVFRSPGRFGWDGGTGTSAYADPAEGLIGILFSQRMMDSPVLPRLYRDFWTCAYGALV